MTAEPLDRSLLFAAGTPQPSAAPLRLVPPAPGALVAAGLPSRAHHFVQAVVEIVEGDRSPTQLLSWTTPRVYENVARRTRLRARRRGTASTHQRPRARVVSVKLCQPRTDVAEVAAHVRLGARSHALAVRLEGNGERWICTALEWG